MKRFNFSTCQTVGQMQEMAYQLKRHIGLIILAMYEKDNDELFLRLNQDKQYRAVEASLARAEHLVEGALSVLYRLPYDMCLLVPSALPRAADNAQRAEEGARMVIQRFQIRSSKTLPPTEDAT